MFRTAFILELFPIQTANISIGITMSILNKFGFNVITDDGTTVLAMKDNKETVICLWGKCIFIHTKPFLAGNTVFEFSKFDDLLTHLEGLA